MMRINSLLIFIAIFSFSCKSYKKVIDIVQLPSEDPAFVKYISDPIVVSIFKLPIRFKITNQTKKDRYFWDYSLNYGGEEIGKSGTLYFVTDYGRERVKAATTYPIKKGETKEFIFYTYHLHSNKRNYFDQFKDIEDENLKNKKDEYIISDLEQFKEYFPNFTKDVAKNDVMEIVLDRQNGKIEYLTFKVNY